MSLIVRDSLGLGIKKTIPKEKIYTNEENEEFTWQLLSEKEKEELKKEDILPINIVRGVIVENCNKDAYDKIDSDLLITIDSRINYNIYIIEDNVYTYEELCTSYPFQEFNILPNSIFTRQIIVIFDDNSIEVINDGDPIISTYDLIKLATNENDHKIKKTKSITKSKVFIGGEKWKDFLQLRGFFRGMIQVSNLQIDNGQTPEFLKPFTMAINNQLMIENATPTDIIPTDATSNINEELKAEIQNIKKNINLMLFRIQEIEKILDIKKCNNHNNN